MSGGPATAVLSLRRACGMLAVGGKLSAVGLEDGFYGSYAM